MSYLKTFLVSIAVSTIAVSTIVVAGILMYENKKPAVATEPAPRMANQRAEMWALEDGFLVQVWSMDTVQRLDVCLVVNRLSNAGSHGALVITCTPID